MEKTDDYVHRSAPLRPKRARSCSILSSGKDLQRRNEAVHVPVLSRLLRKFLYIMAEEQ